MMQPFDPDWREKDEQFRENYWSNLIRDLDQSTQSKNLKVMYSKFREIIAKPKYGALDAWTEKGEGSEAYSSFYSGLYSKFPCHALKNRKSLI